MAIAENFVGWHPTAIPWRSSQRESKGSVTAKAMPNQEVQEEQTEAEKQVAAGFQSRELSNVSIVPAAAL